MTTTDINEPGGRWTVRRMLADLILLAERHKLPEPERMGADEETAISVNLSNLADLQAWAAVLGDGRVSSQPYGAGSLHNFSARRHGNWVRLSAVDSTQKHIALAVGAVAGLEEIAAELDGGEQKCTDCGQIRGADHTKCWGLRHGTTQMIKPEGAKRLDESAAEAVPA